MSHRNLRISSPQPSTLHEPFLERAAESDAESSSRALGAFLTMRLVDQFDQDRNPIRPEALAYQIRATRDYLRDLHPPTVEVNHLGELVRVADGIRQSRAVQLLVPPLLAFAFWLEQELRVDEALDVLETGLRLCGGSLSEEAIAARLQLGRVLRLAGRLEEAGQSYTSAGQLAAEAGDTHSEFLSRIGCAVVAQRAGNLPQSESMLKKVLAESSKLEDRDAEARACHDLANTMDLSGRTEEGIPLVFRAFELYEQPLQKVRALHDLGVLLKTLGHYAAAEDAFTLVVQSDAPPEICVNTTNELLEIAVLIGDRIAFERRRREAESKVGLSPYLLVDFELKVGVGFAAFGHPSKAEKYLSSAVEHAEEHHLNQLLFQAEAALRQLREGGRVRAEEHKEADRPDAHPEVEAVADRLQELRATV
ncbi:MAG: hypothetical protein GTN78_20625 [Gemmatimonadales bacterium]|nr:hypothetical protein [Gemmatimonadales bacterium]NIN10088.1 hypothetical protein [Gemmatimonadales bacterium]NIR02572.1 hypothetical protein [Gemmatimonadales bacterium]NIS66266.1 hypothetical protein [Gemmatimonadales bacterium]